MAETQELAPDEAAGPKGALPKAQDDAGEATEAGEASVGALATSDSSDAVPAADARALAETRKPGDNLALILDVPVHVTVELARTMLPVNEVLGLTPGSVVQFDRQPGEPVDILVNGQCIARGDVVIVNDRFGVSITALMSPGETGEEPGGQA